MKELILGLRGWSFGPESERTDYGPDRAYLGPDRADLKPDLKPGGRTDRRTDGRTSVNSPLCPTGHRPFGAAAQKKTSPNHHCSTPTFSSVSLVVDTTSSSSLFLQLLAISSFAASKNKSSLVECHATLHPAVLLCHLVCQLVGSLLDSGPEGADDLSSHKSQYKSHIW